MKMLFITCVLFAVVVLPAMAQTEDKFNACAAKTGKAYAAARDEFLAAPVDAAFLKQKLKSRAWRERLAARILLGWQQHGDAYRKMLTSAKEANQAGDKHYVWAMTRDGIQGKDVPLMYELLMKSADADAAWDAARAILDLTQHKAIAVDVALLHQFLQDPQAGNAASRGTVAWLIGSVPANYQILVEIKKSLKTELGRNDKDRAVALALLDGLGRAASTESAKEKDQLVQVLRDMDGLASVVGDVSFTYAVGNIGGNLASSTVIQYLAKTGDEVEKLWALRALSKGDCEVATKELLKYTDNAQVALRTEAIRGLGRAHYLPAVAAKLEAIALDKKASSAQQVLAVRSLAQIGSTHAANADLQKQIQNRIQTIGATSTNTQLRQELNELLKSIQPR